MIHSNKQYALIESDIFLTISVDLEEMMSMKTARLIKCLALTENRMCWIINFPQYSAIFDCLLTGFGYFLDDPQAWQHSFKIQTVRLAHGAANHDYSRQEIKSVPLLLGKQIYRQI